MYTCQHCNTDYDGPFCPACGVRRPVALIDQNPNIKRTVPAAPTALPAPAVPEGVTAAAAEQLPPTAAEPNPQPPETMLEAMFGPQAVESFTYIPRPDDGLPLAGLRAYFSTGGSFTQAIRIIRHILRGDTRAAAQCSISAYGRKGWFFLLLPQAVVVALLALTVWLNGDGTLLSAINRCSVLWGACLLLLVLLTRLLGGLLGGGLRLPQTLSLVLTSALPLIALLPFACLAAWVLPMLLPPVLWLCGFAMLATLYMGVEFAAMTNGRRSLFLFVLAMLPEGVLLSLLLEWLILS